MPHETALATVTVEAGELPRRSDIVILTHGQNSFPVDISSRCHRCRDHHHSPSPPSRLLLSRDPLQESFNELGDIAQRDFDNRLKLAKSRGELTFLKQLLSDPHAELYQPADKVAAAKRNMARATGELDAMAKRTLGIYTELSATVGQAAGAEGASEVRRYLLLRRFGGT